MLLFASQIDGEPHGLRVTIGDLSFRLVTFKKLAILMRSMKHLFDAQLAEQFDSGKPGDDRVFQAL